MVNTLFYVKYSLGPGDEVISETCCRLAQTKVNLMNKYEFMNWWPAEQEALNSFWPQDQSWEKPIWALLLKMCLSSKYSADCGIPMFKFHISVLKEVKSWYPKSRQSPNNSDLILAGLRDYFCSRLTFVIIWFSLDEYKPWFSLLLLGSRGRGRTGLSMLGTRGGHWQGIKRNHR